MLIAKRRRLSVVSKLKYLIFMSIYEAKTQKRAKKELKVKTQKGVFMPKKSIYEIKLIVYDTKMRKMSFIMNPEEDGGKRLVMSRKKGSPLDLFFARRVK